MATAFINDLIRAGTRITTSIGETSTSILARIGRTAINHPLTVLALIACFAHTLIMGAITILTVATIHAWKVQAVTSLSHQLLSATSQLLLVPEQTNGTLSNHKRIQTSALQECAVLLTWHDKKLPL